MPPRKTIRRAWRIWDNMPGWCARPMPRRARSRCATCTPLARGGGRCVCIEPCPLWGLSAVHRVVPIASGGSSDADNIILGSPACNLQELGAFAPQISAESQPFPRLYEKSQLSAVRKELMSGSVQKCARDALDRMTSCVDRIKKRARSRQPT